MEIEGGSILKNTECGCPPGTEIEVRDIFYNVPARRSFLKTVSTEHGHILSTVIHQALSHINIHFILTGGGDRAKIIIDLPSVDSIEDRVLQIYGNEVIERLISIPGETPISSSGLSIYGLVSKPVLTFRNKENQLFFVNKRAVKNPSLSHAVQEAYRDLIPGDSCPMVVLFIDIATDLVDVNVHPTKREVRFRDSRYIHDMVVEAIRGALQAKERGKTPLNPPFPKWEIRYPPFLNGGIRFPPLEKGGGTVSEGFNPFIEKTHYQAQELYTEPLVRIFGQTGALFIIAEINGELSIIDQHAAHERVIYDRLKRGYER